MSGSPKLQFQSIWESYLFQGKPQYTRITTIAAYLLIRRIEGILFIYNNKRIILRWKKKCMLICLKLAFSDVPRNLMWVARRVIYVGFGVQMMPRCPAG